MMSEYHFGYGHGRLSPQEYQRIADIIRKHGMTITNAKRPGEGWVYWFAAPDRGEPFNDELAKAVMAEVGSVAVKQGTETKKVKAPADGVRPPSTS